MYSFSKNFKEIVKDYNWDDIAKTAIERYEELTR